MRRIWETFRAALGISGGNHRTHPTLSAPDQAAAASDEGSVGDLLSALPDDLILLVLLHLPSAADAARTCVLSRRWRRVWAQLPELRFQLPTDPAHALPSPVAARAALALHAAPALQLLRVDANDADPRDVAAVLRLAAPRITGKLYFYNVVPEDLKDWEVAQADVELPCFDRAEQLILFLGYLRLVLPPSAVFTKLSVVDMAYVRFPGACDIGDAFSSTGCPSLSTLSLYKTQGLTKLTIHSNSLLSLRLHTVEGLQQLTAVAPELIHLEITRCFYKSQQVVDIVAPRLEAVHWTDRYDPSSVHFGELAQLRILSTLCFAAMLEPRWGTEMLLQHFWKIPALSITIIYPNDIVYYQYRMEALTLLSVEKLHLDLATSGHAVISCVFHFLKISTSIRKLFVHISEGIQEQTACSPDCICHQPQDWKAEELCLNSLQELYIFGLSGADDDLSFLKRLLGWTPVLKTVTIIFDPSAIVDEELWKELRDLSRPETCMEFYLYCDAVKDKVQVPEARGA